MFDLSCEGCCIKIRESFWSGNEPGLTGQGFRICGLDAIPPSPDTERFRRTSFHQAEPSIIGGGLGEKRGLLFRYNDGTLR
jgi:hypothetical protein